MAAVGGRRWLAVEQRRQQRTAGRIHPVPAQQRQQCGLALRHPPQLPGPLQVLHQQVFGVVTQLGQCGRRPQRAPGQRVERGGGDRVQRGGPGQRHQVTGCHGLAVHGRTDPAGMGQVEQHGRAEHATAAPALQAG
ncbi:Octanoyltransferase [Mycolicibacterium canariasense]|uniref:Octanoyltransferase n=1 Tax=Mycolicibacterium canariasense TaxID=228230 RepID=A0A100WGA6_MYCCR|nr:Octanoyltransferase [Mycolicibacterium canariasense]